MAPRVITNDENVEQGEVSLFDSQADGRLRVPGAKSPGTEFNPGLLKNNEL